MKKINFLFFFLILCITKYSYPYTLYSEKASINGDTIFFFKNVDFKSNDYNLTTDSSYILKKDSLIYFPKSFILRRDDSVKILAKLGVYFIKEKKFLINFQTTEKEKKFSINSETLKIFLDDSLFVFSGYPLFENFGDNYKIFGDKIEYYKNTEKTFITGNSTLMKNDSSYTVKSQNMVLDDKDSTNIFSYGVEIFNDSFNIKSDSVIYDRRNSYFKTLKRGEINSKSSFFQGDTFIFYFKNDSLNKMVGKNNIVFENENDNIIKIICDSVDGSFKSSQVDILNFFRIKESELLKKEKNDTQM